METMKRDPGHIAKQVKFIRRIYGLTQENLAEAAGITTRTIEKVESGRHCPNEQTLRSIARAIQVDGTSFFVKRSQQEEEVLRSQIERGRRKTAFARTNPIHSPAEFLGIFRNWEASQIDTSSVEGDEAMDLAASMTDWIRDLGDCWADLSSSQQLDSARSVVEIFCQLEALGYVCFMGTYRMQDAKNYKPPFVLEVGVTTVLPKDENEGERLALIELGGPWETMEADRFPTPEITQVAS